MASSNQKQEITLFARSLKINQSDCESWNWVPGYEEPRNKLKDAAEINDGTCLDIEATFNTKNLFPGSYEVLFDVLVKNPCHGWKNPVTVGFQFSNTKLEPEEHSVLIDRVVPRNEWTTILVGKVTVASNENGGTMTIYMRGGDVTEKKKGLVIQGVRICGEN